MPFVKSFILAFLAVLIAAAGAWAQTQGHIQLRSTAEVEKEVFNAEGQKEIRRVPAAKVVPGSEVIFTTIYENISQETAQNAVITNPIPEHMVYKEGSARGGGAVITFSVDNGKSFHPPAELFIYDAAGRQYPARPQDTTQIRWTFESPLPPGAKGEVSFRAILK